MIDKRQAAEKQWNATPCGTGDFLSGLQEGSLDYFNAIRDNRYHVSDPWLNDFFDWTAVDGKNVLEIGHGIGTDLVRLVENGATVSGIDTTERHHKLAMLNLKVRNLKADLMLGDATSLPYENASFDQVYSLGVLHHMEAPEKCVGEIFRVLRAGGKCTLALYYSYSAFHIFGKILNDGLHQRNLFKLGYRGLMSTIEQGADGRQIKPFVRTYSKSQVKRLLSQFSSVRLSVHHFKRDHLQLPYIGPLVPASFEAPLEKWLGWYVVAEAVK